MTLPENFPVDFTAYNHLTFLPLGRKNKSIRSVGSKHTKGLLGRLNDYFERAMNELSQEDIVLFQTFLYGSASSETLSYNSAAVRRDYR